MWAYVRLRQPRIESGVSVLQKHDLHVQYLSDARYKSHAFRVYRKRV